MSGIVLAFIGASFGGGGGIVVVDSAYASASFAEVPFG
jgi:hypothetical protein